MIGAARLRNSVDQGVPLRSSIPPLRTQWLRGEAAPPQSKAFLTRLDRQRSDCRQDQALSRSVTDRSVAPQSAVYCRLADGLVNRVEETFLLGCVFLSRVTAMGCGVSWI